MRTRLLATDAKGPDTSVIAPDDPRLSVTVTGPQWARFIGLVSDGVPVPEAAMAIGIGSSLLEGLIRTVPERYGELKEARLAAARRDWDYETVYAICDEIAVTGDAKEACVKRGKEIQSFLRLALRDPVVKDLYDTAQQLRAELWSAEVIRISDDMQNDFDLMGKPNAAAVKRSDLQVATRLKLMEHYNDKKYGSGKGKTEVNVDIHIDAAARLESARKRAANRTVEMQAVAEEAELLPAQALNGHAPAPATDWLE